jgi:hypothetical protein
MQIELNREDPSQQATLATLPRFNAAEIHRRRLLALMLASGALAAALLAAAAASNSAIARSLLSFNGAALLLLCAGLQSAYGLLGAEGALIAALLHNLSTLLVLGNAGRLLRFQELLPRL